jgi:hypothetical protein
MMANIFLPLQRIIILQGIERAAGRELSNEMIQRLLRANAHSCSIGEVNEQIAWLENRGYVKAARLGDSGFIRWGVEYPAPWGGSISTPMMAGLRPPLCKMRKVRRTFSSRTKIPRCLRRGIFIVKYVANYMDYKYTFNNGVQK